MDASKVSNSKYRSKSGLGTDSLALGSLRDEAKPACGDAGPWAKSTQATGRERLLLPRIAYDWERWQSGRMRRFAKPVYGVNLYRGFESRPLRLSSFA